MPLAIRVTQRAERDLIAIARYTRQTWGAEQRNRYMAALDARFGWLAANPGIGRDRSDIRAGFRSFPEGQHVIFYRVAADAIELIGVVHRARDLPGALTGP